MLLAERPAAQLVLGMADELTQAPPPGNFPPRAEYQSPFQLANQGAPRRGSPEEDPAHLLPAPSASGLVRALDSRLAGSWPRQEPSAEAADVTRPGWLQSAHARGLLVPLPGRIGAGLLGSGVLVL